MAFADASTTHESTSTISSEDSDSETASDTSTISETFPRYCKVIFPQESTWYGALPWIQHRSSDGGPPIATNVLVSSFCNEGQPSLVELKKMIASMATDVAGNSSNMRLRYVDDDGDLLELASSSELVHLLIDPPERGLRFQVVLCDAKAPKEIPADEEMEQLSCCVAGSSTSAFRDDKKEAIALKAELTACKERATEDKARLEREVAMLESCLAHQREWAEVESAHNPKVEFAGAPGADANLDDKEILAVTAVDLALVGGGQAGTMRSVEGGGDGLKVDIAALIDEVAKGTTAKIETLVTALQHSLHENEEVTNDTNDTRAKIDFIVSALEHSLHRQDRIDLLHEQRCAVKKIRNAGNGHHCKKKKKKKNKNKKKKKQAQQQKKKSA